MSDRLLEITGLRRDFHDGEQTLHVLRGVDFEIARGEIVAVVGMSGSGKSTLLHLIGGLDRPTDGAIRFDGQDLAKMSGRQVDRVRRDRIGIVFQFHQLLPIRAWENVALPALISRKTHSEAKRQAIELLERVGMADRVNHLPTKLSGGEQQRVALARALMNDPELVLADEPTGSLDAEMAGQVIDILWDTVREKGRSLLIVTHEPTIAKRAHRILRLEGGRLKDNPDIR
jgi:predicted ABC-type transport system involved in lysophospholipase L1 biosynthesis ATPase subunit